MRKAQRNIDASKVREMCIRHQYYTCGDNAAYTKMLQNVGLTDADNMEQMQEIADDIYFHSDTDRIMSEYGCDEAEVMDSILYNLYNECCTTFIA